VRACVQCGLSIGETAAFCPVCGARFDAGAAVATLEATQADQRPQAAQDAAGAEPDRWAEAQPYEPSADLVADLANEPAAAAGSELDASTDGPAEDPELDASTADKVTPEADPEAPQLDVDVGARSKAEPEAAPEPETDAETAEPAPPEPETPPEPSARDRKLAAVGVLLEAASGCEEADMPRAAALYQEAILGCLDAADDSDAVAGVDDELLRGFDGLSSLLERQGLAEEALGVVDDAASLGLLNGGGSVAGEHRDALKDRREDLRRVLFADSAQL
jgi:hypothetical protein